VEASHKRLHRRFWVEAALSSMTGLLFVVTLFWHHWLEVFGFDPDHGDGTVEWVMVSGLALMSVASGVTARIEWLGMKQAAGTRLPTNLLNQHGLRALVARY